MGIPSDQIERARLVPVESVIETHGIRLRGTVDRCGPCPRCGGQDRFSINVRKQVFLCRGCGAKGGVVDLTMFLDNSNFATAIETLSGERIGHPRPRPAAQEERPSSGGLGALKAVYDYTDESGELLFQALRFEPKQFRQRTGPGQAKWSIEGVRIVPFDLPDLIEDIALGHLVFVVEGEKDVLTLRDLGIPATTNPMGAGKWREEFNSFFHDADVVICGDNDKPGRDHVEMVAENLHGVARRVRALDLKQFWPGIGEGDDISDWLARGEGTVERLHEIVDRLPDWKPKINGAAAPALTPPAPAAAEEDWAPPEHSEEALALCFADRYAGGLRYVAAWSRWLSWTSVYWRSDDTLHAFNLARKIAREAASICGAGKQKRKLAAQIASAKTVAAVERLAKADRRIAATIDQWDDNPDIFTPEEARKAP
jgi:putative DNA primase/helicase